MPGSEANRWPADLPSEAKRTKRAKSAPPGRGDPLKTESMQPVLGNPSGKYGTQKVR